MIQRKWRDVKGRRVVRWSSGSRHHEKDVGGRDETSSRVEVCWGCSRYLTGEDGEWGDVEGGGLGGGGGGTYFRMGCISGTLRYSHLFPCRQHKGKMYAETISGFILVSMCIKSKRLPTNHILENISFIFIYVGGTVLHFLGHWRINSAALKYRCQWRQLHFLLHHYWFLQLWICKEKFTPQLNIFIEVWWKITCIIMVKSL